MVEQFLDEARLGLKLNHANLVTFYDFGQAAGGNYFMAMELLRGVDFDHLIYAPPGKLAPPSSRRCCCKRWKGCTPRTS